MTTTTGYASPVFFDTLEELFEKCDICVRLTDIDSVRIDYTIRMTGAEGWAEGDTLDEACQKAIDAVMKATWILEDIADEYGITVEKLRELIGPGLYEDAEVVTSGELLEDDDIVAAEEYERWLDAQSLPHVFPALVGAAQPFVVMDEDDNLFLALKLGRVED